MQKIPTVFKRDPDDMRHLLREVHPDCQWVLNGEGVATRKFDGTCVMFDGERWWARREVKLGKPVPVGFEPVSHDDTTGKTVGWEPVENSGFAKWHAEVVARLKGPIETGTYELCGPKVNGNPEDYALHVLVRHATAEVLLEVPRDFDGLAEYLTDCDWEGIVWHHPDGRMAKLKGRDFGVKRGRNAHAALTKDQNA